MGIESRDAVDIVVDVGDDRRSIWAQLKKRKRCVHPYSVIRDFVEMRSPADSNAQAEIA